MTWYQILTLVMSALSLCGFGVLAKLVIEHLWHKKQEQSEEEKARKKKERQDLYREVIQEELKPIKDEQNEIKQSLSDTKAGIQAELRHDIRNACRRCLKQGFKTVEDLEEVVSMHDNYERLGSNGKTNALYVEFMKLPTKEADVVPSPKKKSKKAEA